MTYCEKCFKNINTGFEHADWCPNRISIFDGMFTNNRQKSNIDSLNRKIDDESINDMLKNMFTKRADN